MNIALNVCRLFLTMRPKMSDVVLRKHLELMMPFVIIGIGIVPITVWTALGGHAGISTTYWGWMLGLLSFVSAISVSGILWCGTKAVRRWRLRRRRHLYVVSDTAETQLDAA